MTQRVLQPQCQTFKERKNESSHDSRERNVFWGRFNLGVTRDAASVSNWVLWRMSAPRTGPRKKKRVGARRLNPRTEIRKKMRLGTGWPMSKINRWLASRSPVLCGLSPNEMLIMGFNKKLNRFADAVVAEAAANSKPGAQ